MSALKRVKSAKKAAQAAPESVTGQALQQLVEDVVRREVARSSPELWRAVQALEARRFEEAETRAIRVVQQDEASGFGWYVLAVAREHQGELTAALLAYERALAAMPDHPRIANDLGRLAEALRLPEMAVQFYERHLARNPGCVPTINSLAGAYRQLSRFDEAVELLRSCLYAQPEDPALWNGLGAILAEEGRMEEALVFYDEAVRLAPDGHPGLHNRAACRLALGDVEGATADGERALAAASDERPRAGTQFLHAYSLLTAGRLAEGWEAYEIRRDPLHSHYVHFLAEGDELEPAAGLRGKRLLVIGEQGLGDEVMFAGVLPEVIRDIGPEGRLLLAVEMRLVPLMQRSFPAAAVMPHHTLRAGHRLVRSVPWLAATEYDGWTRMGGFLRTHRRELADFPARPEGFLKPDPERVEHWRRTLAELGSGPKVGMLWKSMKMTSDRSRFFSPFEAWRTVLKTPGLTFVNLQYGDCADELAQAREVFGVEIVQPPGIDLKDDLDDLGALCVALDLTVGPATATTNIAAACGARTWFISTPDAWPRLGSDHYPWYGQARVFASGQGYGWNHVMADIAQALRERFAPA
jgi:tetratricopeptide (TPR) repeat protein